MEYNGITESIDIINVPRGIKKLLKCKGILNLQDLCSKTKTDLKQIGLNFYEINKIQVEVQLLGLNLKKCE